jgi:hypothetical protein
VIATVVDWAALGQVIAYSFVAALLLTALFTTGVLSSARHGTTARAAGAVSFALCAGLVALGLYVMFTTK